MMQLVSDRPTRTFRRSSFRGMSSDSRFLRERIQGTDDDACIRTTVYGIGLDDPTVEHIEFCRIIEDEPILPYITTKQAMARHRNGLRADHVVGDNWLSVG